jgi:gamma-glutamyl-gamma-aminobutyrate hydrolase PuuD
MLGFVQPLVGLVAEYTDVAMHGATHSYYVANRFYVNAVRAAGGLPVVLPHLDVADAGALLDRVDAIVLCGGVDIDPARYGALPQVETRESQPARDDFEMTLVTAVLDRAMPMLGVCRGVQSINVALGGTLQQHLLDHPTDLQWEAIAHEVTIAEGSRLAEIVGRGALGVNSLHHQAVDRLGRGVRAVAWAPDGVVEAIEVDGAPGVLAVQWHPEVLCPSAPHQGLFADLVRQVVASCV